MKYGQILSVVVILIIIFYSCGENTEEPTSEENLSKETVNKLRTRHQSLQRIIVSAQEDKKINAKAFYYKTLADFQLGHTTMSMEQLSDLSGKRVEFVVLYEVLAPWNETLAENGDLSQTGDDTIDGMLEVYSMNLTKKFELDDNYDGLVIAPDEILEDPIQVAKELSEIDYVIMVQVKEIPKDSKKDN